MNYIYITKTVEYYLTGLSLQDLIVYVCDLNFQTPESTESKVTDTKISKDTSHESIKPGTSRNSLSKATPCSVGGATSSSGGNGSGGDGGRGFGNQPSFRSRTDSVIEYTPPMVGEAAGSTFYITKTGHLDYVVLLKVCLCNKLNRKKIDSFLRLNEIYHFKSYVFLCA